MNPAPLATRLAPAALARPSRQAVYSPLLFSPVPDIPSLGEEPPRLGIAGTRAPSLAIPSLAIVAPVDGHRHRKMRPSGSAHGSRGSPGPTRRPASCSSGEAAEGPKARGAFGPRKVEIPPPRILPIAAGLDAVAAKMGWSPWLVNRSKLVPVETLPRNRASWVGTTSGGRRGPRLLR